MIAVHHDGRLLGQGDVPLYWQAWLPAGETRALLIIAHGGFEHSGRYGHVAERLAQDGVATYALDFRGHGRSPGQRANIERMALVVDDLDRLRTRAASGHPGRPVFLLGHSMGSLIAIEYALAHQPRLAGLILSGTAVDVSFVSPAQLAVARLLSAAAPRLRMVAVDGTKISRDPAVVRAYDEDPLVYRGKAPARMVAEALTSARRSAGRLGKLTLPVLLLHGGADELALPSGAELVLQRAASADKTRKLYEGLYHEVLNEPERDAVVGDLAAWITARS
jgi:acylglycerol lipase